MWQALCNRRHNITAFVALAGNWGSPTPWPTLALLESVSAASTQCAAGCLAEPAPESGCAINEKCNKNPHVIVRGASAAMEKL